MTNYLAFDIVTVSVYNINSLIEQFIRSVMPIYSNTFNLKISNLMIEYEKGIFLDEVTEVLSLKFLLWKLFYVWKSTVKSKMNLQILISSCHNPGLVPCTYPFISPYFQNIFILWYYFIHRYFKIYVQEETNYHTIVTLKF